MAENRENNSSNLTQPSLMFRDEALSHLSSTNDMNKLITLTKPHTWMLLVIFILVTIIGIGWAIFGRIPITLQGQGILIPQGGVFESVTAPEGVNVIQEMKLHVGEVVKKGEVIAILENPELKKNIQDRKQYLSSLKEKVASTQSEMDFSLQAKAENKKNQAEILSKTVEEKSGHRQKLEDFLIKKRMLLSKGYSSIQDVLELENKIAILKEEELKIKEQLLQMEQDEAIHKENWHQKERDISLKLMDEGRELANLVAKYETSQIIRSSIDGKIVSVHKATGDKVLVNDPIVTIGAGDDKNLEALVYFNPLEGKEIKENMKIYMVPTYLEKEHRGYIEGRVINVSPYPETARSLMAILQNEELVKKFSETNPPIGARVSIDPESFKKASTQSVVESSPSMPLSSGTWVYTRVVIKEKSPLELIIPELKKLLGVQT